MTEIPATETDYADSLSVDNLKFGYKEIKALDGVSLSVAPGNFVALLGANGAGKTTLFSIVSGLYQAHSGSVSIMGHRIGKDTLKALANIGVVFQRSTLDMDLTVLQNLRYAADLQGLSRHESKKRISDAVELHSMGDYDKRKVAALSGGQKRRVELARALLHKPSLLLLDEPTVGLDLNSRSEFVAHVRSLCQSQQTGVLWATHLMEEIEPTDTVFVLDHGKIIAKGSAAQLLAQHNSHDVSEMFNTIVAQNQS